MGLRKYQYDKILVPRSSDIPIALSRLIPSIHPLCHEVPSELGLLRTGAPSRSQPTWRAAKLPHCVSPPEWVPSSQSLGTSWVGKPPNGFPYRLGIRLRGVPNRFIPGFPSTGIRVAAKPLYGSLPSDLGGPSTPLAGPEVLCTGAPLGRTLF